MAIPVLLAQLRIAGVKIYAASSVGNGHEGESRASADWREPAAVFVGNEGAGLPAEIMHAADAVISIPTAGTVESLNAGVAASIVLYEAARQRAEAAKGED
jgi:RNA methyltransferase, TrmH family